MSRRMLFLAGLAAAVALPLFLKDFTLFQLTLVMVYGIAMSAWWLVIIGFTAGAVVTCGFVFEYYRGEHAH